MSVKSAEALQLASARGGPPPAEGEGVTDDITRRGMCTLEADPRRCSSLSVHMCGVAVHIWARSKSLKGAVQWWARTAEGVWRLMIVHGNLSFD